jgi:tRNA G46 methylase TrmB
MVARDGDYEMSFRKWMMGTGKKANELADAIGKRSVIKDPKSRAFRKSGSAAANIVERQLKLYLHTETPLILDFGSGSGRVALPLAKNNPSFKLTCVDVDQEAIAYLVT